MSSLQEDRRRINSDVYLADLGAWIFSGEPVPAADFDKGLDIGNFKWVRSTTGGTVVVLGLTGKPYVLDTLAAGEWVAAVGKQILSTATVKTIVYNTADSGIWVFSGQ